MIFMMSWSSQPISQNNNYAVYTPNQNNVDIELQKETNQPNNVYLYTLKNVISGQYKFTIKDKHPRLVKYANTYMTVK